MYTWLLVSILAFYMVELGKATLILGKVKNFEICFFKVGSNELAVNVVLSGVLDFKICCFSNVSI